ncbi:MAG: NAD-dependent epimerase/dehydratase family protein [Pseudomonadota bacterium]
MGKKILVTGGAGFIGSNLSASFLKAGHVVEIVDDLSTGSVENIPEGSKFHKLDIRSEEIEEVFENFKPDVLCHHAAAIDVRKSVENPSCDADINIFGLINLMEIGKKHGLKKVIFASSGGAIYGEQEYFPACEKHALNPISPYGVSKLSSEKYLNYYKAQYGIDYVALRYANVYGPKQNHLGEAGVVAIFMNKLLRDEECIIFGDGLQTRDYVSVMDVCKANLKALNANVNGVFNIATSKETNVKKLHEEISKILDKNITPKFEEARMGEQKRSVLSYALAKEIFEWEPEYTLTEGLEETAEYFRSIHA